MLSDVFYRDCQDVGIEVQFAQMVLLGSCVSHIGPEAQSAAQTQKLTDA